MTTFRIEVGTLPLTEAVDVSLPQQCAAWHQTVRVEPGVYPVYAYVEWSDGDYRLRQLSARAEGVTVSSNFRSRVGAHYGASDNNCNGQPAVARIDLGIFGPTDRWAESHAARASLSDLVVRREFDPRELDPGSSCGRMWRLEWRPGTVVRPTEGQPSYASTLDARVVGDVVSEMEARHHCRYERLGGSTVPVTHEITTTAAGPVDEALPRWAHVSSASWSIANWRVYDARGRVLLHGEERNHGGDAAGHRRMLRAAVAAVRNLGARRVYPRDPAHRAPPAGRRPSV